MVDSHSIKENKVITQLPYDIKLIVVSPVGIPFFQVGQILYSVRF